MEYSLHELCQLSGVSARTLRYYDEIGLLKPVRVDVTRYRYYDDTSITTLQTILFYRALRVPLSEIRHLLCVPLSEQAALLKAHLLGLLRQYNALGDLIHRVETTLASMKGDCMMQNSIQFEELKQTIVQENEALYGEELRHLYGDEQIAQSNAKIQGMTPAQYQQAQALSAQLEATLQQALLEGDPSGTLAQKAFALHKQWLCYHWPSYSKQAHKGLAALYLADERFTAYYDAIAPGAAQFLHDAIASACS